MRRTYNKKFPNKIHVMEAFLSLMLLTAKIIVTPPDEENIAEETAVIDIKDRPILRAAIKSDAELLISGDHHFLKSGLKYPKIINPADFLNLE